MSRGRQGSVWTSLPRGGPIHRPKLARLDRTAVDRACGRAWAAVPDHSLKVPDNTAVTTIIDMSLCRIIVVPFQMPVFWQNQAALSDGVGQGPGPGEGLGDCPYM